MVPVVVAVKVPPVIEVATASIWTDPEPEACSKRPVPPVIVQGPLSWKAVWEVGHAISFAVLNSLSPFAAVKVSFSVTINPPWHDAGPVAVLMAASVVFPRCSRWPVPVMMALFCDGRVKDPEKLPLRGVEWVANATGNAPNTARTDRIVEAKISLFISFLNTSFLVHRHQRTQRFESEEDHFTYCSRFQYRFG